MASVPIDADPAPAERIEKLSSIYRALADSELRGYCPIYEQLARHLADDPELLARYSDVVKRIGMLPILLFACVHDLVLAASEDTTPGDGDDADLVELAGVYAGGGGDPWPPFRQILHTRFDEVADLMRTRAVQTNEVGRTAAVLPALTAVARQLGQPLALVELGPSAGLNLFFDRYAVDYGDGVVAGPPDSPVRLSCERLGGLPLPLPERPLDVSSREGIDLNPLDVTDEGDRRWLDACLWPGHDDRRAQLQAAIDIARVAPPTLHRGSAVDLLAEVLSGVDGAAVPCVISTWVLGYFTTEQRHAVKSIVDAVGEHRSIAFITGEYPGVTDWLDRPDARPPIDDQRGASLLGLTLWDDGRCREMPVAWMQAHGRWLHWFDASTAGSP